jgi:2-polyprenyl-6-methoxyphenol hydroxylase-like FAD-dependent oxidoreductase
MSTERRAEIVGGGFAGLAAAAALAQRGWRVRVHERADALRTEGAGIYIYENGLRVLEALGACDEAIAGAHIASTRETRDDHDRILSVHRWDTTSSRVYSIVRQRVIDALAAAARRAGAEIVTGSAGAGATPQGELVLADGRRIAADLIVAADGVNSRIRDSLGLLRKRKQLPDGAIRLLIDKTDAERAAGGDGRTIEYWSGTRRIVFTPCSDTDIYIALTMLNADEVATRVPVERAEWARSFPHLADLIARFGPQGHYAPFEWIRLARWSAGRVAVIGDAAHALPPNIGQGAGCAMMNALSLAVHLDGAADITAALAAWEARERPITEHTQRVSVWLGVPTTWPPALRNLTFRLIGKSKWLVRQRIRTALHRPTGTRGVERPCARR